MEPRVLIYNEARVGDPLVLVPEGTVDWESRVVGVLDDRIPHARIIGLAGDHACHIQSIDRFLEEPQAHLH